MSKLDEQIAYFAKCAEEASTKELALVAFGIYSGLRIAKAEFIDTTILQSTTQGQ